MQNPNFLRKRKNIRQILTVSCGVLVCLWVSFAVWVAPTPSYAQETVGTGPVQLRLTWANCADVDLILYTPTRNRIDFRNKTADGGELDVDANVDSECKSSPIENIFFTTPPNGTYEACLVLFGAKGLSKTDYTLQLLSKETGSATAKLIREVKNSLLEADQGKEKCLFRFTVTSGRISTPIPPTPTFPPITASFNPNSFTGELCNLQCFDETVTVKLPALPIVNIQKLDVFIVLDITGSMGNVLDGVKRRAVEIVQRLQTEVRDTQVGLGVYADYPDKGGDSGDEPWRLVSNFTRDAAVFERALNGVRLQGGGDVPESAVRALYEVGRLSTWRPDAIKIVLVFADAPGKDPDPGVNVTFASVLEEYKAKGIRGVSILSGAGGRSFFEQLAKETSGVTFQLSSSDDIATTIIDQVKGILRSLKLSFRPTDSEQSEWLVQTPDSVPYPQTGNPYTTRLRICPKPLNLQAGKYTVNLQLTRGSDALIGTLPITFDYAPQCNRLVIADVPGDTGLSCTNENSNAYWKSPDIVVRKKKDDIRTFEFPSPGQEAYAYVRVTNKGVRDVSGAELLLTVLAADGWHEIARQRYDLKRGEDRWLGPFAWTPQTIWVWAALRAYTQGGDDRLISLENVACEAKIAEINYVQIDMDSHSLGSNLVGGGIGFGIVDSQKSFYDQLDLLVNKSSLSRDGGVVMRLSEASMARWLGNTGRRTSPVEGGVFQNGNIIAPANTDPLTLRGVTFGSDVKLQGGIWLSTNYTEYNASQSTRPVDLILKTEGGKTNTGLSVFYRLGENFSRPSLQASPVQPAPSGPSTLPPELVPMILAGLIVGIAVIWFVIRQLIWARRSPTPSSTIEQ
jgi:hypothetical protein